MIYTLQGACRFCNSFVLSLPIDECNILGEANVATTGDDTMFNNSEWLRQISEEVVDPDRDLVDPHHHLWPQPSMGYNLTELLSDTSDGHKVSQTVYMECGAAYFKEGPEHLMSVGETEFIANAAKLAKEQNSPTQIAGLIAHADLRDEHLDSVLDAHDKVSNGLFRGVRQAGACAAGIEGLVIPGAAEAGLFGQDAFRRGLDRIGQRGLTFDTWLYHFQLRELIALARAVPETTIILDHFGTPLGVGPFAGQREAIFETWKSDIAELALCPNVFAKLGGLAMPDNGFGWYGRDIPPSSDEFVDAQSPYYEHTIACFGPERCMFESNFPVDRLSVGYRVLWNAFKKMTSHFSEDDKNLMFSGVARKVYRLETP